MRLNEYQVKASKQILKQGVAADPILQARAATNALLGINAEVGALNGCYLMDGSAPGTSERYKKLRLGAELSYMAELCTANNWTLEEIAEMSLKQKEGTTYGIQQEDN